MNFNADILSMIDQHLDDTTRTRARRTGRLGQAFRPAVGPHVQEFHALKELWDVVRDPKTPASKVQFILRREHWTDAHLVAILADLIMTAFARQGPGSTNTLHALRKFLPLLRARFRNPSACDDVIREKISTTLSESVEGLSWAQLNGMYILAGFDHGLKEFIASRCLAKVTGNGNPLHRLIRVLRHENTEGAGEVLAHAGAQLVARLSNGYDVTDYTNFLLRERPQLIFDIFRKFTFTPEISDLFMKKMFSDPFGAAHLMMAFAIKEGSPEVGEMVLRFCDGVGGISNDRLSKVLEGPCPITTLLWLCRKQPDLARWYQQKLQLTHRQERILKIGYSAIGGTTLDAAGTDLVRSMEHIPPEQKGEYLSLLLQEQRKHFAHISRIVMIEYAERERISLDDRAIDNIIEAVNAESSPHIQDVLERAAGICYLDSVGKQDEIRPGVRSFVESQLRAALQNGSSREEEIKQLQKKMRSEAGWITWLRGRSVKRVIGWRGGLDVTVRTFLSQGEVGVDAPEGPPPARILWHPRPSPPSLSPVRPRRLRLRVSSPRRHVAVVRALVKMGTKHADVALQYAAKLGRAPVCDFLIACAGATVHRAEEVALRVASRAGHVDVVDFLLSHGADAAVRNSKPVRLAASGGHCQVISHLLDGDAQPTAAALIAACAGDKPDVVALLLQRGAPANNVSALDRAIDIRNTLPLRLLLQHRLDPAWARRRLLEQDRTEHVCVTKKFEKEPDKPEGRLSQLLSALGLMADSVH
ncbi:hypothetical protein HK097_009606 [Rhizophlyctis rosea]|uniref:Uncharacterized protein n=1 Tax=Rhizophlyctis rosea TaxID=64517 RepID=A0AAD5SJ99_9FUNG|nr:hypothetical protein HK097_009606 [Rhizophlyctis rosea]